MNDVESLRQAGSEGSASTACRGMLADELEEQGEPDLAEFWRWTVREGKWPDHTQTPVEALAIQKELESLREQEFEEPPNPLRSAYWDWWFYPTHPENQYPKHSILSVALPGNGSVHTRFSDEAQRHTCGRYNTALEAFDDLYRVWKEDRDAARIPPSDRREVPESPGSA